MITSRGTTPVFQFKFPELISNYDAVLISFSQNGEVLIDKTATDLTFVKETIYSLRFTEDEINTFNDGLFECQIRVCKGDEVSASHIYRGRIVDVLNDEILGE